MLIEGGIRKVHSMSRDEHGYFHHSEPNVAEGQRYTFRIDGGPDRPDPCSRRQPECVHGPSAVYRPERFAWKDNAWVPSFAGIGVAGSKPSS